jgi:hypothetical protein
LNRKSNALRLPVFEPSALAGTARRAGGLWLLWNKPPGAARTCCRSSEISDSLRTVFGEYKETVVI